MKTFKYLGVTLSSDLSWSHHINRICTKARQVLGVLYRRFYSNCDTATLVQLYVSLVRPYLEYACPVWSPYTSKAISKLEKVQKFALRMASHNWSARYSDLLDDLNIPSLETRRSQLKLCQLYMIVNGLCYFPPGLINTKEQSCALHSTNNLCLQQPFAHTSAHLNSFIPGTISVWNTLPNDLTHSLTFNLFKSKLKLYLTNNLH